MKTKSKLLFIFLSSIVAGLLIAIAVTAWTNPIGNPTSGGGALYYSGGNVGIGTTNPGAKLEVAGQVKITGGTPAAGKVLTSDGVGLASWESPTGGGGIPSGVIVMWSGLLANIPSGWALCDGTSGTPI